MEQTRKFIKYLSIFAVTSLMSYLTCMQFEAFSSQEYAIGFSVCLGCVVVAVAGLYFMLEEPRRNDI